MTYTRAMKPVIAFDAKAANEISLIRRMARDGATVMEINAAVGWNLSHFGASYRLKKLQIKVRPAGRKRNGETHFPDEESTDMRAYRPRAISKGDRT